MKLHDLDILIEKYYKGESSTDEESRLKDLLASVDLPEKYFTEKEMFASFTSGEDITEPSAGFEERIIQSIDENDQQSGIIRLKRRIYTVTSVAAGILILISSFLIFSRNSQPADTFDDPMMAYAEVITVLYEVSDKMNNGKEQIVDLAAFNKARSSINLVKVSKNSITNELGALKYLDKGFGVLNKE